MRAGAVLTLQSAVAGEIADCNHCLQGVFSVVGFMCYTNIVQGERRANLGNHVYRIVFAEPYPMLYKYKE